MTPPPSDLKNLNVDFFEIFIPPQTLAKTVPNSYLTVKLGLFQSFLKIQTPLCVKVVYNSNCGLFDFLPPI